MRSMRSALFVTLLAVLVTAVVADSADSKSRALRRAKKVMKAITLVDGPGSGLDADSVQGLTPAMVRDANGTFVGALIGLTDGGGAQVIRRIGDHPVRLWVSSGGLIDGGGAVYFESGDCTGQPLLLSFGFPPGLATFVLSQLMYYPAGTPAFYTPASRLARRETESCAPGSTETAVSPDLCCVPIPVWGEPNLFSPAQTLDPTTLGLVPPFRLDVLPFPTVSSSTTTTLP